MRLNSSRYGVALLVGFFALGGCASAPAQDSTAEDNENAPVGEGEVEEVVVSQGAGGSFVVQRVRVTRAAAAAQVAAKEAYMRAAAEGRVIEDAPTASDEGGNIKPKDWWADDVTPGCRPSDFWFHTGVNLTGSRLCFRRNTINGMGTTWLAQFVFYDSVPGSVTSRTRSWWAGAQSGAFRWNNAPGPGLTFAPWQRCDNCTISGNRDMFGFDTNYDSQIMTTLNRCMDVYSYSTSNGASVVGWDCGGSYGNLNQRWFRNGTEIRGYGNKCLDAWNGGGNGAPAGMWDCNGNPWQQWTITNDGRVRNNYYNRCLDLYAFGTSNGTPLVIWDCNGLSNQQFLHNMYP